MKQTALAWKIMISYQNLGFSSYWLAWFWLWRYFSPQCFLFGENSSVQKNPAFLVSKRLQKWNFLYYASHHVLFNLDTIRILWSRMAYFLFTISAFNESQLFLIENIWYAANFIIFLSQKHVRMVLFWVLRWAWKRQLVCRIQLQLHYFHRWISKKATVLFGSTVRKTNHIRARLGECTLKYYS